MAHLSVHPFTLSTQSFKEWLNRARRCASLAPGATASTSAPRGHRVEGAAPPTPHRQIAAGLWRGFPEDECLPEILKTLFCEQMICI